MPHERFDPADEECHSRACFDAKTWLKKYGKPKKDAESAKNDATAGSSEVTSKEHKECPLDIDELGRNTWGFLHTMAANYPEKPTQQQEEEMTQFMHLFGKFYPCTYCAAHFRNDMKLDPPDTRNQLVLSRWLCRMHNIVNVKNGKPKFDCSRVLERWKDGWKDGSCG